MNYKDKLTTTKLSEKAISDLISILIETIGEEAVSRLSKEEINHIGVFILTLAATHIRFR